MLLMLNIHYSHAYEIVRPDLLVASPSVIITPYRDAFGNWCSRLEAAAGRTTISTSAIVRSNGFTEPVALDDARQRGLRVIVICSYARAYVERHPEVQDIVVGMTPVAEADGQAGPR